MAIIQVYLVFVGLLASFGKSHLLIYNEADSQAMIHALENIVSHFYYKHTSTVFIMERSSPTIDSDIKPSEMVNELIRRNQVMMTYVIGNHITVMNHMQVYRVFNIFIIDSYESFRHIFSEMTHDSYDYSGYFTIVLTECSDNCDQTVASILRDCWTLYISNANILTLDGDDKTAILYTFFPFTLEFCENVEPIVHHHFENGTFIDDVDIFPDKLRNFFKCPLKVSTYQFPPFMNLTLQPDGSYYIDGIEGMLFKAMAEHLNFTPIVVISAFNVFRNASISLGSKPKLRRSLEMVQDGSTNLSIGATIPVASRFDTLSMSLIYFYGSLLYAVPPGRPYSSLEKLYFPYTLNIWLCMCAIFVVAIAVVVVLKVLPNKIRAFFIGKSNSMPFFNMLNISLGGSVSLNHNPTRNFARTLFIIWLLSTLVLRNAYQGKLFGILRGNQRSKPILTFDELYNSTLKLHVLASYLSSISEIVPAHRLAVYDANMSALHNLADENFDGAYMAVSQVVDYFNCINFPKLKILKTKEYIHQLPFCIYYRKHSCLLKPFNNMISAFTASGLIDFWAKQFLNLHYTQNNMDISRAKALKLNQFYGIITLCGCIMLISVIFFSFECISKYNTSVKNILDFLTFNKQHRVNMN